jgi:Tol biopolymer transport system component
MNAKRNERGPQSWLLLFCAGMMSAATDPGHAAASPATPEASQRLIEEVRAKGWIVFSARSDRGDWDLAACRPDGSPLRFLTRTPGHNEFSPQFSRDQRRLLYRRVPRAETLDNNRHGEQGELVLANADASAPEVLGKPGELPWASWGPDGNQIASLSIKGIALFALTNRQVVRTLPRRGFFQQLVWSPDGQWLVGVANSYGTGWSVARLALSTGEASAINRVDCCTPDWHPDSRQVIFSWRPPGQSENNGYGWTQLWRADADGKRRQLVYGEDGRHVYGGHVSPEGVYVIFTGNLQEDGDPGRAGAPMGLMRLSDAPIIGGESRALRALHPDAKAGPVLMLPAGWEPCWTSAELFGTPGPSAESPLSSPAAGEKSAPPAPVASTPTNQASPSERSLPVGRLAAELHDCGSIVFSAQTDQGDWDLVRMRPDGSERRRLTSTLDFNEAGARFSPDGKRLLYYRMPRAEPLDNNTYGTFELVLADSDGGNPVSWGNGFAWAAWGPDGTQLACLAPKGIQIVETSTRRVVRQIARRGLVEQLVWSPDGRRFAGTANGLGPFWNIGCLDLQSGELKAISETARYNCTPDWMPDSRQVLYARGIIPEKGGRAELWVAGWDGTAPRPLYAEAGRHIYGACSSPDGKYLLFTRSVEELGKVDHAGTTMAIIRWADTPMIGGELGALRTRLPDAKSGPRLDLGPGWEPHWTAKAARQ